MRLLAGAVVAAMLLAVLLEGCGSSGSANENDTAYRIGSSAWSTSLSNNPYSPDYVPYAGFALLGLGVFSDWQRPGSNPYYPELASSWELGNSTVTLHLRPSARWQNGKPFTSADVTTSLLAGGADYNSLWAAVASVSAPDTHTVVIRLQPWAIPRNVLLQLMELAIVPASQYAHLFPAGFERDVVGYWRTYDILHASAASIDAAGRSAAGQVLTRVSGALIKYDPPTLLGDGPYTMVSANVSGVLYKKWNGWWDAGAMSAPWVQIYPMTSATEYGALLAGRLDNEENSQYPDPQVTKLNSSAHGHYFVIPSPVQQESLVFHLRSYPFNLLAVRQAIAYLIDRTNLTKLDMGGSLIQDPATPNPDGINDFLARSYLSPSQLSSLNRYQYSPSRATSLLQGAGFSKRSGTWYMPNGQPFSFTIEEPSGYSQFDEDGVVIANDMKSFGIQADTSDANAATYQTEQMAGDYAVSENFMDWGVGPPMADFAASFGNSTSPAWNYPISYAGSGPCSCAIGIGPNADVPGLGNVNIASALNDEVNSAQPDTWGGYVWDWSRWVNQNLPILPLYDNAFHVIYSTNRYSDMPPSSQKWMYTVLTGTAEPVVWMQEGYLKLRS